MDGLKFFDRFQFGDDEVIYQNVKSITRVELCALVRDRQRRLSFERNTSQK